MGLARHPEAGELRTVVNERDGRPSGQAPRDILTGFLAPDESESYGRPVGVAIGPDGSRCWPRTMRGMLSGG